VLLAGLGPLTTWRRASPRRLARAVAAPALIGAAVAAALPAAGVAARPRALALFGGAAFAVAAVAGELWRGAAARRALTGEAPLLAAAALVRGNRRRYGGYAAHVGVVVALAGVAGSSAFQHTADLRLHPGQSARVGGYEIRYVQPTASLTSEKISLGALLDVRHGDRHVATLAPTRGYYPSLDETRLGRLGRFLAGESTSEVGLKAGVRRDIWTAVQPDLTPLAPLIAQADRRFPHADARLEGAVLSALVARYVADPPPAHFRLIVSPLVSWIWIGGGILAVGGLFALWPPLRVAPLTARRRVAVRRRARGADLAGL
jgi:cytochrome c-type biogenesis protein CcmF